MTGTAEPGDLSVTALDTSQVWSWGGLSDANLFAGSDAKRVLDATNAALVAVRTLLYRHPMVDHLLCALGYRHIIELVARFSRRGTAATSDVHMQYTEFDLPHVAERKRELPHDIEAVASSDIARAWNLLDSDRRTQRALFGARASSVLVPRDGGR